jgi:hypothetical protein
MSINYVGIWSLVPLRIYLLNAPLMLILSHLRVGLSSGPFPLGLLNEFFMHFPWWW